MSNHMQQRYDFTIASSIHEIEEHTWNSLNIHNKIPLSYEYLQAFESTPPEGMRFRYLLFYEQGVPHYPACETQMEDVFHKDAGAQFLTFFNNFIGNSMKRKRQRTNAIKRPLNDEGGVRCSTAMTLRNTPNAISPGRDDIGDLPSKLFAP